MNAKHKKSWRTSQHRAFTLVEVIASLLLLGTLLVGILVAHRRHAHQIRRAEARLAAINVANQILLAWTEQGTWGAATNSGYVADSGGFKWQWSLLPVREVERFGAAIGRLEIIDEASTDTRPLVSVEVLASGGPPVSSTNTTQ